jgi:hypothetical protein
MRYRTELCVTEQRHCASTSTSYIGYKHIHTYKPHVPASWVCHFASSTCPNRTYVTRIPWVALCYLCSCQWVTLGRNYNPPDCSIYRNSYSRKVCGVCSLHLCRFLFDGRHPWPLIPPPAPTGRAAVLVLVTGIHGHLPLSWPKPAATAPSLLVLPQTGGRFASRGLPV